MAAAPWRTGVVAPYEVHHTTSALSFSAVRRSNGGRMRSTVIANEMHQREKAPRRARKESLSWERRRPSCPYYTLIAMAMMAADTEPSSLAYVHSFIEKEFPYLIKTEQAWKSHVLHSLAQSNYFRQVKNPDNSEMQKWEIIQHMEDLLKQQVWGFIRNECVKLLGKDYGKRQALSPAERMIAQTMAGSKVDHTTTPSNSDGDSGSPVHVALYPRDLVTKNHNPAFQLSSNAGAADMHSLPTCTGVAKKATIEYFPSESEIEDPPSPGPVQDIKLPFTLPLCDQMPLSSHRNFSSKVSTVKLLQMPLHESHSQSMTSTSKVPMSQGGRSQTGGASPQQCDPYNNNLTLMHASAVSSHYQGQPAAHRGSSFNARHFSYLFNPSYPVCSGPRPVRSKTSQHDSFRNKKSELTHSVGKVELQTQQSPALCRADNTQDHLGRITATISRKDVEDKGKELTDHSLTNKMVVVSVQSPSCTGKPLQQPQTSTPTICIRSSAPCTVVHGNIMTESTTCCPPTSSVGHSSVKEDKPMDLLSEYWRDITENGLPFAMDESNTIAESASEEFPPL